MALAQNRHAAQWSRSESLEMHQHACHQSVSCESQEYKTGKSLFSNWCWKSWTATWKQMQLKHTFSLYTEIISKWLNDLNIIKTWHHKSPRREHRQNILWHKLYQRFLRSVSQGNRNNNKSKQTYKLLHSKGNSKKQKWKRSMEWEKKICTWCSRQGLNFQNTPTAHTTQQQKTKQPDQKMG